jgi:hypothetical protein
VCKHRTRACARTQRGGGGGRGGQMHAHKERDRHVLDTCRQQPPTHTHSTTHATHRQPGSTAAPVQCTAPPAAPAARLPASWLPHRCQMLQGHPQLGRRQRCRPVAAAGAQRPPCARRQTAPRRTTALASAVTAPDTRSSCWRWPSGRPQLG